MYHVDLQLNSARGLPGRIAMTKSAYSPSETREI